MAIKMLDSLKFLLTKKASNAYLNRSISNGSVALNGVSSGGSSGGEFGFNLQAYGFLNKLTQQTEYICFVRNVESNSPASRAGLQSGDVLLAIDGVCLSEFRSFAEITQHVRGKNELRLVLMAENISKRIQCQLKAEQIRRILVEKRAQLDKVIYTTFYIRNLILFKFFLDFKIV